jgi:MFS family permease
MEPARGSGGPSPGDPLSGGPAAGGSSLGDRVRRSPMWALLAAAPFRWLLGGQALALVADQAFFVALTWLVLEVAGAGAALGLVLGVAAVPGVALLPVGGWVADRFGPVRVMLFAGMARVVLLAGLAGLALLGRFELWQIALLGGALSAVDALYYPAASAVVPAVVPRHRLVPANSLLQGAEQVSGLAGPVLAGGLIAAVGIAATVGAVALAFAGAVAAYAGLARALARARVGASDASPAGEPDPAPAILSEATLGRGGQPAVGWLADEKPAAGAEATPGRDDLLAGLRYVLADPLLRVICLILAALNVALAGPLTVGGVVLAEERLGGAAGFAALMACFGAGSLAGSLATGALPAFGRRGPALLAATALLGVGLGGLALAPSLVVAGAVGVAMGTVAGFLGVVLTAWLQERTPEAIRGRVMAVVMFAAVALDPVAYAVAGFLAGLGPHILFFAAAGLLLAAAAVGAGSRPVRAFD